MLHDPIQGFPDVTMSIVNGVSLSLYYFLNLQVPFLKYAAATWYL